MKYLLLAALCALPPCAHALTLYNAQWRVDIDPATLAARAALPGGQLLSLSQPQPAKPVSEVLAGMDKASWRMADGARVEVALDGATLIVRFTRSAAGEIHWPLVPAGARALILPLAEGMRIPTDDAGWRKALMHGYQGLDTTADLSLPVAGFDYGARVLSMLLANPYNNRIDFSLADHGIGFAVRHEFSTLDYARPYEVQFALDGADWLAPAKHYRAWAQANGKFVPLQQKLAHSEDGARLIGASHVYLWGERLITPADVRDWRGLQKAIPADWLSGRDARKAVRDSGIARNRYSQGAVLEALETALQVQHPGYDYGAFAARKTALRERYGAFLTEPAAWGDAASSKMMTLLAQSGLEKLWLGLPQWTAAFTAPEGIAAARKAGYLIGPYDSYDTALPDKNAQPDWLSAQLGQDAFERCGFMNADGSRRPGFGGAGVYVNQACVQPQMERRVLALQRQGDYNSWFLDVAATGMAFDDYDPQKPTSQAQDIANRVASTQWIADRLGVVVGSEDGFAVANQGVSFAHGAQTRGFGWRDDDMHKNSASPYFIGPWWPAYQPAYFFRPVKVKPEYRALFFDPAKQLPLLQAAIHDSVVTTHHWTLDALKFSDVRVMRELLAQLYNVPPLVNLSLDTAKARIAYLKRVDAFFRPLHERLHDQALTGFAWLDAEGFVQQTRFSDGTVLIANFGLQPFSAADHRIAPQSIVALLPDGRRMQYAAESVEK